MPNTKIRVLAGLIAFAVAASAATVAAGSGASTDEGAEPKVSTATHFGEFNGSLRDLPAAEPSKRNRRHPRTFLGGADTGVPADGDADAKGSQDPVASAPEGEGPTPAPDESFAGMTQAETGFVPPDTNGDVGPDHYIQTVNSHFSIYDKGGTRLVGPTAINSLWTAVGAGNLCQQNRGDPVVVYDDFADRWLITQFALSRDGMNNRIAPYGQCAAVSQTADPVNGGWFLYEFPAEDLPAGDLTTAFADYPKWSVWPDGYYFSTNEIPGGAGVYSVDRAAMLAGQPNPEQIYFEQPNEEFFLPADADGPTPPPAGDPVPFAEVDDGPDQLQVWEFDVDFATPANSTFTQTDTIPVAAFDDDVCSPTTVLNNCIPQPGQASNTGWLEPLTGLRLMFALKYRNFGSHETLVANHTVDGTGGDVAGVRWYELRHPGGAWALQQQGTVADSVTHRWMGSVAMDTQGNIGLAYSTSGLASTPGIRYTHQDAGDAPGTMEDEQTLITGPGVKTCAPDTDTNGDTVDDACRNRWGDYSSMSVDPSDACTFWFTNEYNNAGGAWETRIGSFDLCADVTTMSVAPNPLDFGTEPVGTIGPVHTLTVTNTGAEDLTVSGLQKSGANPADFLIANDACTGQQVDPSETCPIDLRFAPSATGPRSANLRVSSNASNSPIDVTLTGFGEEPPVPTGSCEGQPTTVGGATSGDDVLQGTPGDDVIRGGAGDDIIQGFEGNDVLCGQDGDDRILAGDGADSIRGQVGVDSLRGGSNGDVIHGGSRDDLVQAGSGDDEIFGQRGPDDLRGRSGADALHGGRARDRCQGGSSVDTAQECEIQHLIP